MKSSLAAGKLHAEGHRGWFLFGLASKFFRVVGKTGTGNSSRPAAK
jgi:hypothetical protein